MLPTRSSRLHGPMLAFALAGLLILTLGLLRAVLAMGPLECQSQSAPGANPRAPPSMGPLRCDLGVTPQEADAVRTAALLGIGASVTGFFLGVIDATLALYEGRVRREPSRPQPDAGGP